MATDCEAWLNANPVAEAEDLSDSFLSGEEDDAGLVVSKNFRNEINGNLLSSSSNSIHEARLKAKAKRRLRKNSSRDSGRGDSLSDNGDVVSGTSVAPSSPKSKLLDRKSRLGKGRGLPKKGGAGGKGVWGRSGEVYELEEVDQKDPNYDEAQENCVYETVVPPLDERDFEKTVTPIVQEYFEHGDTNEVAVSVQETTCWCTCSPCQSKVPSLAVSLALEAKASHRELTSRLLADLCGPVLSLSDMEKSFDQLLLELPDLVLDTPGAPQLVGQFIARAVSDQILSKSYIDGYKGRVDCQYTRVSLDRAAVLLRMSMGGLRIDNQWGTGGGQRPVIQLIKEMNLLLKEYILSGDSKEAEKCLKDLEVPHFHHEFVYEAIVMMLESKGEKTVKMVLQLLKSLSVSSVISIDQMRRGYERVYMDIAEINIDVPRAYFILEQCVDKSFSMGIIDVKLRDLCPCRGRKRFVSEGDGGVVKLESY
uniref:Programmed cell death protein 4 n=1 Tax=Sander lucioperca TaxID=283035 RepID=A0A8C9Z778_SANLU